MRRITARLVVAGVGLTLLAAGCGSSGKGASSAKTTTSAPGGVDPNAPEVVAPGDIPDTQVYVALAGPGGRYSIKVPEGWARKIAGSSVTLTDHYNSVMATATRVVTAPTAASVQTTEVPRLRRSIPNFELVKVATVTRAAGTAVLVSYRAGSARDPVTGKRVAIDVERYEFWRSGTLVTLTLSGARGSDNVDPWKTVTNSFTWTK